MFEVNAVSVLFVVITIIVVAKSRRLDHLQALLISFCFLLINTTKFSMGSFSYSFGLCCIMVALIIIGGKFSVLSLIMSLFLISIASTFKIYFAIFSVIPILIGFIYLDKLYLAAICAAWALVTTALYGLIIQNFPLYFDSIYLIHKVFQSWDPLQIKKNIMWFLDGFLFIIILPFITNDKIDNHRKMYLSGFFLISVYVVMVMLAHKGSNGSYIMHIIAPCIIGYPLIVPNRQLRNREFITNLSTLILCISLIFSPFNYRYPIQRLRNYGVTFFDIEKNTLVLKDVEDEIINNHNQSIYLDPIFSILAMQYKLPYIDNGNKEYYIEYFKLSTLRPFSYLGLLAGPRPVKSEQLTSFYRDNAEIVICVINCPTNATHWLKRKIGEVIEANEISPLTVNLFVKIH